MLKDYYVFISGELNIVDLVLLTDSFMLAIGIFLATVGNALSLKAL